MSTVSADPWFPLPERTPGGLTLVVAEGTREVHDYYAARADGYVVLASSQLKQLVTDWYVFNESAATLRQTGAIGDATPEITGGDAEFVVNSAVLFPTATDGIRGEIALTRYPFEDIILGRVPARPVPSGPLAYLPVDELAHTQLLDRVVERLQAGDAVGLAALLTDDHAAAVRVDDGTARAHVEARRRRRRRRGARLVVRGCRRRHPVGPDRDRVVRVRGVPGPLRRRRPRAAGRRDPPGA